MRIFTFLQHTLYIRILAARILLIMVLILQDPYCISQLSFVIPAATPPSMWAVGWMGYVNTISKQTGNSNRQLTDKTAIVQNLDSNW